MLGFLEPLIESRLVIFGFSEFYDASKFGDLLTRFSVYTVCNSGASMISVVPLSSAVTENGSTVSGTS